MASDIFTLFTAAEIRNTRDKRLENLETLILAVSSRLFYLYRHVAFPNPDLAPAKELVNCIRILTRIMPFIYEQKNSSQCGMAEWEERFFWGKRRTRNAATEEFEEVPALGKQLIDTAIDLLFYSGFTIPRVSGSRTKVVHSIWETGVGCSTPITSTQELLSNKVEVLRFLLTLTSDCLYQSSSTLAANGSRYLTYMVTKPDKHSVMAVLCSLLNVTLKYSPGWKVPYDHMLIADRNRQLVTYSLQLLQVLLVYPLPKNHMDFLKEVNGSEFEDTKNAKNWYRHYLSKIHKPQDFQFISDSLQRLLAQPIQASTSYLPGSRREIEWVTELTMLFWDLIQCNKKFKAYMIMSSRVHDFTVLLLYYMHEKRTESGKQGLVRLCAYVLLHLSADITYAKSLAKPFEGQNALPSNIKLPVFNGSYADYLIIQLFKCVSNSGENLNFLIPTLLDCIYNISPYVENISYLASSSLMQLFNALSSQSFFLANDQNRYLLESILRTLNLLVHCNFRSNKNLVFCMMRNEKGLLNLQRLLQRYSNGELDRGVERSSTDNFVIDDEDHPVEDEKKLSAKEKGKQPITDADEDAKQQTKDDEESESLQENWVLLDELLLIIKGVKQSIPAFQDNDGEILRGLAEGKTDPHQIIDAIGSLESLPRVDITPQEPTNEEFVPVKFVWNDSSLGWYESILWGSIFEKEHQVGAAMHDAPSVVSPSVITVGVWNGTDIKLFKVREVAPSGPTFLRPKGAVDAVADTVIQKFGKLQLNFTSNSNNTNNGTQMSDNSSSEQHP